MKKNYSPWIHQLEKTREIKTLDKNEEADILVIGAGIAGVMSSYFTLKNTEKNVILLDSDLAGHGASGHNAGQLTTYFERPLSDISNEFGIEMTCEAQKSVESAWKILKEIQEELKLKTPIYKFIGYAGMTELKQILLRLADNMVRYNGGIAIEKMLISDNFTYLKDIPSVYSHLYEVTSHQSVLDLLETDNKDYIATLSYKKGATNSARICEELIDYMLLKYSDRFKIYENSPVKNINLNESLSNVEVLDFVINASKIVLCTNGFENFKIINNNGKDIDTKFHHHINGRINYMSAYLDDKSEDPIAISYFPKEKIIKADSETTTGEQYFYVTRRPHLHNGVEMGLISTGGPEKILKEEDVYVRDSVCEDWAEKDIDKFLKSNYKKHKSDNVEYDFCWHGLLGYTTSGIRLIGEEPNNINLIYNLGCNGIGIMPAIYGAEKVSEVLSGKVFKPSIFDPRIN